MEDDEVEIERIAQEILEVVESCVRGEEPDAAINFVELRAKIISILKEANYEDDDDE